MRDTYFSIEDGTTDTNFRVFTLARFFREVNHFFDGVEARVLGHLDNRIDFMLLPAQRKFIEEVRVKAAKCINQPTIATALELASLLHECKSRANMEQNGTFAYMMSKYAFELEQDTRNHVDPCRRRYPASQTVFGSIPKVETVSYPTEEDEAKTMSP